MNSNQNQYVAANQLVWGDVFRPAHDKRMANTWYRVLNATTDGGKTLLTYRVEGTNGTANIMRTASLATMEVQV